jgi:threonine dehydrogenase-like Zn-dependent dehydrogenase
VLIIGAGPIGLAALQFVKLSGARAIVMDVNRRRLEFCQRQMGVDEVVEYEGEDVALEQLRDLTGGELVALVIDATGNHQSMSSALQYAGFTGRVVYVGITTAEIRFVHPLMHRRELTLFASRNALPVDFQRIVQLIEEGRIDTLPWITHRAAFESMITEFPEWLRPEAGVVKAMVAL